MYHLSIMIIYTISAASLSIHIDLLPKIFPSIKSGNYAVFLDCHTITYTMTELSLT